MNAFVDVTVHIKWLEETKHTTIINNCCMFLNYSHCNALLLTKGLKISTY